MDTDNAIGKVPKSRKAIAALISRVAWHCESLCNAHGSGFRPWEDIFDVCMRQEREHVAFGRRLLGREPERRSSLRTRADYFAAASLLRRYEPPRDWEDAEQTRADWRKGAAMQARILKRGGAWAFMRIPAADAAAFLALDYARDLA